MTVQSREDTGVSEVISTILLIACCVVIAAVVASSAYGMTSGKSDFNPVAIVGSQSGANIILTLHGGSCLADLTALDVMQGGAQQPAGLVPRPLLVRPLPFRHPSDRFLSLVRLKMDQNWYCG